MQFLQQTIIVIFCGNASHRKKLAKTKNWSSSNKVGCTKALKWERGEILLDIIQFSGAVQTQSKSWWSQIEVDFAIKLAHLPCKCIKEVRLDTYVKFATLAISDQVTQRAVCPLLDSVPNHIIHFQ